MEERSFRVVIAGAGIAGLTMANCLEKAGIDYRLYEKYPRLISPQQGAGMAVQPPNARLMHQLGCFGDGNCLSALHACRTGFVWSESGRELVRRPFHEFETRLGYPILLGRRTTIMELLHDALEDKSRLVAGRSVERVSQTPGGLELTLSDGSVERADILVGADGVHSTVRAAVEQPATEQPFASAYKCLFGVSKGIFNISAGDLDTVQGQGSNVTVYSDGEVTYFAIVAKKERPTAIAEHVRYTKADEDEMAATMLARPINSVHTFGDLWASRTDSGLTDLQEGVWRNWHSGRVVLLGDSAHKVTPELGLGANLAMQDAAALANRLVEALRAGGTGTLDQRQIREIFSAYEESRKPLSQFVVKVTAWFTRVNAKDGLLNSMAARIAPYFERLHDQGCSQGVQGIKLSYVPVDQKVGTWGWDDTPGSDTRPSALVSWLTSWYSAAGAGIIGAAAAWSLRSRLV